jgi:sugar lactone lactonase YvrE
VQLFNVAAGCVVTANGSVSQATGGANPKGMAMNRAGTRLYVGAATGGNPNLAVFSLSGGTPSAEQDYGLSNSNDSVSTFGMWGMAVAADGLLYVLDGPNGTLHVVDPTGYPGTIIEEPWSPISGATGTIIKVAP